MKNTPYFLQNLLNKGGRLTKHKGVTASIAPSMVAATVFMLLSGTSTANVCGNETAGPTTITCNAASYTSPIQYIFTDNEASTVILNTDALTTDLTGVSHANSSSTDAITTEVQRGKIQINNTGNGFAWATHTRGITSGVVTSRILDGEITLIGNNPASGTTPPAALRTLNFGSGDAVSEMLGGSISTQPFANMGLYSQTLNGRSITRLIDGKIVTSGDQSYGAYSFTRGNQEALTEMQGGTIITEGLASYGLFAWQTSDSNADLTARITGGNLETSGDAASGILARNEGGSGNVLAEMDGGNIGTKGNSARGIHAFSFPFTSGSGSVQARINDGTITTEGTFASAVFADLGGAAGLASTQMSGGNISTSGGDSHALYSRISNTNNNFNASANMSDGSINTSGTTAHGLFATTTGLGSAITSFSGGSITATGGSSYGLHSSINNDNNSSNASSSMSNGNINISGNAVKGIYALTSGQGSALSSISGGSITATGSSSYGLHSIINNNLSSSFSVATMNNGVISVSGSFGNRGVNAQHRGLGDSLAEMNDGQITVATSNGSALYALISERTSSATATARMNGGDISTSGTRAEGIRATAQGDNSTAIAELTSGNITTQGDRSAGVYSEATYLNGQANSKVRGGSITTLGDQSHGAQSLATVFGSTLTEITAGSITTNGTQSHGGYSLSLSTGEAVAKMDGGSITTLGNGSYGLHTYIQRSDATSDSQITINGGNIATSGEEAHGAYARNSGTGNVVINTSGGSINASGENAHGIYAQSRADVTMNLNAINVTSGTQDAAAIFSEAAQNNTITIGNNAIINGVASGRAIVDASSGVKSNITSSGQITGDILLDDGEDSVNLLAGSLAGDIEAGDGSDTVMLGTVSFDGNSHVLDGGSDNTSANDDLLQFNGWNGFAASQTDITLVDIDAQNNVLNFERIELNNNADVTFSGNQFGVDSNSNNVDLTVADGSTARFKNSFTIQGDLNNFGSIDLSGANQTAGTTLTVGNDYTAGSNLYLDVVLGDDNSPTDKLITTTTSGLTDVYVNKVGGTGAQTQNGIRIVEVGNPSSSTGTFELANGDYVMPDTGENAIIAGAFGYALRQGSDGNWYLQSSLQPSVAVYEALPQTLLGMLNESTLAQRIEGRQMLTQTVNTEQPTGTWLRMSGQWSDIDSDESTSQTQFKQQTRQIQAGIDGLLDEDENGKLVAGINFSANNGTSQLDGSLKGDIKSQGHGIGLTATWYGNDGFYSDMQLQVQKLNSDLSSDTLGSLADDLNSSSELFSIEFGKKFELDNDMTITPQAQLTWKRIEFDDFTGPNDETVSLQKNRHNQTRLGVAIEKQWRSEEPEVGNLYGIANIKRNSQEGTGVNVSGASLNMKLPEWSAEIGVGGSYDWQSKNRTTSLYGEVSAEKAISGGNLTSVKGNIGVRVEW